MTYILSAYNPWPEADQGLPKRQRCPRYYSSKCQTKAQSLRVGKHATYKCIRHSIRHWGFSSTCCTFSRIYFSMGLLLMNFLFLFVWRVVSLELEFWDDSLFSFAFLKYHTVFSSVKKSNSIILFPLNFISPSLFSQPISKDIKYTEWVFEVELS